MELWNRWNRGAWTGHLLAATNLNTSTRLQARATMKNLEDPHIERELAVRRAMRRRWRAQHPGEVPPWAAKKVTATRPTEPGLAVGPVLPFGCYSGWHAGQIAAVDENYLAWVLSRPFMREKGDLYRALRDFLVDWWSAVQQLERDEAQKAADQSRFGDLA